MPSTAPPVSPRVWHHEDLVADGLEALAAGGADGAPLIDGRVLSVKATPQDRTASEMAVGVAVLPAGLATPPHAHEAEELATILSGEGLIVIEGVEHPVRPGTVVLTPSRAHHVTIAGPDAPLVVWWVYAPAGSEQRWARRPGGASYGS